MKYHKVIIENPHPTLDNPNEASVAKVADCFVNPVLKDIKNCLKELKYGRPDNVQSAIDLALEAIINPFSEVEEGSDLDVDRAKQFLYSGTITEGVTYKQTLKNEALKALFSILAEVQEHITCCISRSRFLE